MISKNLNETVDPKKQLSIYGYKDYLDFFIKIYQKNKLPNVILLNGPKGIGKAITKVFKACICKMITVIERKVRVAFIKVCCVKIINSDA